MTNPKYDLGLPNGVKNKTYADASKHIENMFKDRNSVVDLATKKTLLTRLKDAQEAERQRLAAKEQALQQNQMQQQEQNQMAGGGYPDYFLNQLQSPEFQYGLLNTGRSYVQPPTQSDNSSDYTTYDNDMSTPSPITLGEQPLVQNSYNRSLGLRSTGNLSEYEKPNWLQRNTGKDSWLMKEEGANAQSVLGGVGLAASILGPMISNRRAMKSLEKPSMVNPMQLDDTNIQPNFVNRQQLLRNAAQQAGTQREMLSQSGGNWNQFTSGMANLNANLLSSTGNLMLQSDIADQQEKARIQGMKQNIGQYNIEQRNRADELNAQNMAAYNNQLAAYKQAQGTNIGNIGQSLFNLMQARKYGKTMGQVSTMQNLGK